MRYLHHTSTTQCILNQGLSILHDAVLINQQIPQKNIEYCYSPGEIVHFSYFSYLSSPRKRFIVARKNDLNYKLLILANVHSYALGHLKFLCRLFL